MKIGFTGTRGILTEQQQGKLLEILQGIHHSEHRHGKDTQTLPCGITEFHHGDCVGGDMFAHNMVMDLYHNPQVMIHPPKIRGSRAFCVGGKVLPEKDFLDRDHDIVRDTELLIACPKEMKEIQRSGTWATIREARRKKKPVIIIYPSGTISREEN